MAYYGIIGGGVLSASTQDDTISFFNSTAVISGSTILGLEGNDLIYAGPQGWTGNALAQVDGTAVASGTAAVLSASLAGSGTYSTSTSISAALQAGTTGEVTITGIITSQRGVRNILASQINGGSGDDSILLGAQLVSMTSTTVLGGDGNDNISNAYLLQGVTSFGTSVNGSTGSIFTANKLLIEAGSGSDTIAFNFDSQNSFGNSTIAGNQGNDQINITSTSIAGGNFSTSQILMGGGDDTLSATFVAMNTVTVNGGGGNDTISLQLYSGGSAVVIDGDYAGTLSTYDGNDLISAVGNAASGEFVGSTIYGGGGNDTIAFNITAYATVTGQNLYALNVGDDLVSGVAFLQDTIQMGAGNDSITIGTSTISSQYYLGGNTDTITFAGLTAGSGATFAGNTVYGGEGADYFSSTNGIGDLETAGMVWALSSISDSTLTARDTIGLGTTSTSVMYRLRMDQFNVSLGSFRTGDQSATNGVVTFTAGTDSSLTARANIINGSMTAQGNIAAFVDGSNRDYLFIQGGADGYSIVQLGNGVNTGISAVAVAGGKNITVATLG